MSIVVGISPAASTSSVVPLMMAKTSVVVCRSAVGSVLWSEESSEETGVNIVSWANDLLGARELGSCDTTCVLVADVSNGHIGLGRGQPLSFVGDDILGFKVDVSHTPNVRLAIDLPVDAIIEQEERYDNTKEGRFIYVSVGWVR